MPGKLTKAEVTGFRGMHPSGAPGEIRLEIQMPFETAREFIKAGAFSTEALDQIIVALMTAFRDRAAQDPTQ